MNKKYVTVSAIVFAAVVFWVFLSSAGNKTLYIKNNKRQLPIVNIHQKLYQAEDKIGDISNTIIPKINIPENITKDFAGLLAKAIIDKNNQPKDDKLPAQPSLNVPDPSKIAEEFITSGLAKANENILNIKPPEIKTSTNNSKETIKLYLTETQKILKDNLNGEQLLSILEEINKNNGQGLSKLLSVISAHESAANQIEKKQAPSDLKNLITEEIRLLRITANILRALTNIENDPLGALAATKQFEAILPNWSELQQRFDSFTKKINKS